MQHFLYTLESGIKVAFQEIKSNRLRTLLSLTGITIGIFSIIAVFTVLDSLERNIKNEVSSLGDDIIYFDKWPWMDDNGEYKWWDFLNRPVMGIKELNAVEQKSNLASFSSLYYRESDITATHEGHEIQGVSGYAVTEHFEKMQKFDLGSGRYFNATELAAGNFKVVLGQSVYSELFPSNEDFKGKSIRFLGRKFLVIGVLKKSGSNVSGTDLDNGIIYPYFAQASIKNVNSLDASTSLMVKAKPGIPSDELSSEIEGILRAVRKVEPEQLDNFSINKLSQITDRLNTVFGMINIVGSIIAVFSLLVGGFGIANIMFVTVRERTKIIGLKKAVGAKSASILSEFLIEAIILCLIGGIIGIFSVFILGIILTQLAEFPVTLTFKNFFIGIGISTIVGLVSGFIPARSAARLHPVNAIRTT